MAVRDNYISLRQRFQGNIWVLTIVLFTFLLFYPLVFSNTTLYYFYVPTCEDCLSIEHYLSRQQNKYPHIEVKWINQIEREEYELRVHFDEIYRVHPEKHGDVPAVFLGNSALIGKREIKDKLEGVIRNPPSMDEQTLTVGTKKNSSQKIKRAFESFTTLPLVSAGVIDGVNPCAFATLLFFVSFILGKSKNRYEVLLVGLTFSMGVFLTYLLIGMGLSQIIYSLKAFSWLTLLLYLTTAVGALFLAVLSFSDYLKIRRGRISEITLQLSSSAKDAIRKLIKNPNLPLPLYISSFLVAIPISLLEFSCTGQIYLPTIMYVMAIQEMRSRAIFYLVIYNLFFILPLVLVFLSVYIGTSSLRLVIFFKKRLGSIKILLTILFSLLSVLLFWRFLNLAYSG